MQNNENCDVCVRSPHHGLRCGGCESVFYCSQICQTLHWEEIHSRHCEGIKKCRQLLDYLSRNLPLPHETIVNRLAVIAIEEVKRIHSAVAEYLVLLQSDQHLQNKQRYQNLARNLIAIKRSCEKVDPELEPPNPLRRYKDFRKLRHTIYGKVYRAVDTTTNRAVAIKQYEHDKLQGRLGSEDAYKERVVLARLSEWGGHEGVCGFVETFVYNGDMFLVMEFLNSGDLYSVVESFPLSIFTHPGAQIPGGVSPTREAVFKLIFRQIVKAVKWLHDHNIAHRDLDCENIVMQQVGDVDNQGKRTLVPKIIDFGQAVECKTKDRLLTEPCGKKGYCEPGIYFNKPYNAKECDCYSLGVVLYVISTSYAPCEQTTGPIGNKSFWRMYEGDLRAYFAENKLANAVDEGRPAEGTVLSDALIDLLQRLICEPDKRLDIDGILKHAWLKEDDEEAEEKKTEEPVKTP